MYTDREREKKEKRERDRVKGKVVSLKFTA